MPHRLCSDNNPPYAIKDTLLRKAQGEGLFTGAALGGKTNKEVQLSPIIRILTLGFKYNRARHAHTIKQSWSKWGSSHTLLSHCHLRTSGTQSNCALADLHILVLPQDLLPLEYRWLGQTTVFFCVKQCADTGCRQRYQAFSCSCSLWVKWGANAF